MKQKSRPQRWYDAAEELGQLVDTAKDAVTNCNDALEAMKAIQEEYQEWLDNLPESGMDTVREKLDEVTNIDFDVQDDFEGMESARDEAEGIDLPLGFGRD